VWAEQLARTEAIRTDAYQLKAADEVSERFLHARIAAAFAVALIATGVVLLGLAPNSKPTAASASLVTLTLNEAGRAALGCPHTTSLKALKTGGTATAPTLITFPVRGCPSKTLTFATAEPGPLGTVAADEPVGSGG
jgi:hypothetical protein